MPATSSTKKKNPSWLALLTTTILSTYFYVLMEWVFFVTKPSSLSSLSFFEAVQVFLLVGGAVTLLPFGIVLIISLLALLNKQILRLGYLVPASVLTVTALIMLDNFTYTVFKFGVISTRGNTRLVYAIGLILLCIYLTYSTSRPTWKKTRFASFLSLSLLTLSTIGFAASALSTDPSLRGLTLEATATKRPNIIILGADGLSAKFISAYGGSLNTTPFLLKLKPESLFAENAFPNAASTTASTTSILTGKESTAAQVFRYPDILSGANSFEHLPGILQANGYLTVQIGTPYYVDASNLNLLNGFDVLYNQALDLSALDVFLPVLGNSQSMYFLRTIAERADERLLHIYFNRRMASPVAVVHDPKLRISDSARVDLILKTLDEAEEPVFIFTHLMNTHGPEFASEEYVFSTGKSSKDWDVNNYLDAVLDFDNNVRRIYEHLEQTGELDNTILVIYTDHGFTYTINERVPLIIHFPNHEFSGNIRNNVQVIDVPVTLLDYMGIVQPEWMTGASLLTGEPSAERMIISTTSGDPEKIAPPFYQINVLQGIVCGKWFRLNVREDTFSEGLIKSHTAPCATPNSETMHQRLLEYLEEHGYDTTTLRIP